MSHTMSPPTTEEQLSGVPLADAAAGVAPTSDPQHARGSSFFARHGLSNTDVCLVFAALLLTSVYLPMFSSWSWTPRMMIIITASLPGLVALVGLVKQRDRAAQFGLAALAWMALSALLSGEALLAFKGHLFHEASALAYFGAFGLWALGRGMSDNGRRLLGPWILGAFGLNVVFATIQIVTRWTEGDLALSGSRAAGLTPNAGHLGAFTVAGVAMCIWGASRSASTRPAVLWTAGAFAFGTGLAYSGSRIGLGALVLMAAWVIVTHRRRWSVLAFVGSVSGVLAGTLLGRSFGLRDSISRSGALGSSGDRLGGRIDMWSAGLQAVQERPILGWGAGRYRTATQERWSFDFVGRISDSQQIPDAHNVVIAMVVAIGIPGLLLLAMFVWHSARQARGPLAVGAAAISITWLFQPAGIVTLPLAMLMFGAAMGPARSSGGPVADNDRPVLGDDELAAVEQGDDRSSTTTPPSRTLRRAMGAALTISVLAAGWLGVADLRFASAASTLDPEGIDAVAPMFFDDPVVGRSAARAWRVRATFEPDAFDEVIERHQAMVDAEPKRPYWWNQLAAAQGQAGLIDDAVFSVRQAIELQPTSLDAWRILLVAAGDLDDDAMADEAMTNLCRLGAEECNR